MKAEVKCRYEKNQGKLRIEEQVGRKPERRVKNTKRKEKRNRKEKNEMRMGNT